MATVAFYPRFNLCGFREDCRCFPAGSHALAALDVLDALLGESEPFFDLFAGFVPISELDYVPFLVSYGGPVGQGPAELSVGFWVPLLQKLLQGFRLGVSRFLVAIFPLGHCWPYSDRVALCMPLPSRCSGWTRWRSRDNFHNGLSGICGGCLHLSRGSAGDQKITECQRRARGRSGGRRHRLRSSLIFG